MMVPFPGFTSDMLRLMAQQEQQRLECAVVGVQHEAVMLFLSGKIDVSFHEAMMYLSALTRDDVVGMKLYERIWAIRSVRRRSGLLRDGDLLT